MSRMYDPKIARFIQNDSYRGDVKDPLSLNLYTYCHNEPMMYTDPNGHNWITDVITTVTTAIVSTITNSTNNNTKSTATISSSGHSSSSSSSRSNSRASNTTSSPIQNIENVVRSIFGFNNQRTGNTTINRPKVLEIQTQSSPKLIYRKESIDSITGKKIVDVSYGVPNKPMSFYSVSIPRAYTFGDFFEGVLSTGAKIGKYSNPVFIGITTWWNMSETAGESDSTINNRLSKTDAFPQNPYIFNPEGLEKKVYKDGEIIKWHNPDNGKAEWEWDNDGKGGHYHKTPDGKNREPHPDTGDTHYKPGDKIPK